MATADLSIFPCADGEDVLLKEDERVEALEHSDHGFDNKTWHRLLWAWVPEEFADNGPPASYTKSRPGSYGKRRVLRRRCKARLSLWHDGDFEGLVGVKVRLSEIMATRKDESHWNGSKLRKGFRFEVASTNRYVCLRCRSPEFPTGTEFRSSEAVPKCPLCKSSGLLIIDSGKVPVIETIDDQVWETNRRHRMAQKSEKRQASLRKLDSHLLKKDERIKALEEAVARRRSRLQINSKENGQEHAGEGTGHLAHST